MADQMRRSDSGGSSGCSDVVGPNGQGSFAEVTVIDSQFQHFSSYIEVIRVFKCRLCTFCSPLEHVIASHMSEVHFPRRCFLCKQCLFVFEDRAQLTSHLESAHGTKSIAVCFGDLPPGAGAGAGCSPPPTLRMMMRTTEGEERIQQQMMEETPGEEARNGRVTSSTGNLANLTNVAQCSPPQPDCMEQTVAEPETAQPEGDRAIEPPSVVTVSDTRPEQMQSSRSSSCHPSSSNQVYSSPEIIDIDACNPRQPEAGANLQPTSQPPSMELRVTIGNTYCQSYIKTEPISPVRCSQPKPGHKARPREGKGRHDPRSYMRRWSLTEKSLSEDNTVSVPARMSRSFDVPGSESVLQNGVEEEGNTNSESGEKLTSQSKKGMSGTENREGNSEGSTLEIETNNTGKAIEKSKSLDMDKAGEKRNLLAPARSYQGGRSVDGRPPRLVRQSGIEESPRSSPQLRVLAEENSTPPEQNEVALISAPCSAAEAMRREHFSRSFPGSIMRPPGDHYPSQKHPEGHADLRPTLRDLVSNRMERADRQMPPSSQGGAPGSCQDKSIPVTGAPAPPIGSMRSRSYSISEGDVQGFPKSAHPEGCPVRPAEIDAAALERDRSSSLQSRLPPGNPQVPAMLHHPHYPGLVYQPYSIEGEPKHLKYYNQGPRMAGPGHMDGQPHHLRMRPDENGQLLVPGPNQQMEDSFLYRYLRNNGGRKYRRNSISMGSVGCGDVPPSGLKPSHGPPPPGMVPHTEGAEMIGFDRQRGLMWPSRHHPDHPFQQQGPFPSHMPPYPVAWKDKFEGSQVSPNTSASTEPRHGVEYSSPQDRDAMGRGEMVNGPNGVVLVNGQVMRAKPREGGESNQDLAKDITRQVQQAMGVTQGLYTPVDRHLPQWMEGNDRSDSPEEPMEGDPSGQRRSRKSTFNIYREIPERKRKLDHEEEEKIKHSYNPDGSFDYFSLTGWKAYKCDLCKKRRFKTASELQEHKQRKHGLQRNHSSQGSLNGLPEAAASLTMMDGNEPNDSPPSG